MTRSERDPLWWHLALVVVASAGFELVFLHHGINMTDEGWPLYAAMQLHGGGTLYQDVFFVFPPGHLLAAWIGYGLDPPGVTLTRAFYASFNVALCAVLYVLGRRLMPPGFALLGALLVAFAAPQSHYFQLLFGYRYLVWSALALLFFALRVSSGDRRWLLAAGLALGVALCFRLTPAFAAGCGIGAGILAAHRSVRESLRDASWLAAGGLVAIAPVLLWLGASAGLDAVWREAFVRPVEMTALQTRPMPELAWPAGWSRAAISQSFVPLLFRLCIVLYVALGLWLSVQWWRSARAREPFSRALLLAVVVWGGVYFARSLGRSDAPHLDSAIPPVCLLTAFLLSAAVARLSVRSRTGVGLAVGTLALLGWVALLGTDTYLSREMLGTARLASVPGGTTLTEHHPMRIVDTRVREIVEATDERETILDLTASPLFHVLSGRRGPGYADVVMPGTFRDAAEETAFLERLRAAPPALVIWPQAPFDGREDRAVEVSAPRVTGWVKEHYERSGSEFTRAIMGERMKYFLMVPKVDS